MAEESSRESEERARERRPEHQPAQATPTPEGLQVPTNTLLYPSALFGDPRLNGRGNQPVKIATTQQVQRMYGNRAARHFLQRQKDASVKRGTDNARASGLGQSLAVQRQPRPQQGTQPDAGVLISGEQDFREGVQFFQAGEYVPAIELFERARRAPGAPTWGIAANLFNIGTCHSRLGNHATAVTYLEMALDSGGINARRASEAKAALAYERRMAGIPEPSKSSIPSSAPTAPPPPGQRAIQRQESQELPDQGEAAPAEPRPILEYEGG